MHELIQFALLGLGAGAIYALLAQGIVVIFRGSGVLNLAHGAFAMFAAYLYYALHVEHGVGMAGSFAGAVVAVTAISVATDMLLMRRLRTASPLSRLIGTLGVLIVLQSLALIWWGSTPVLVLPIFPVTPHQVLGATLTSDRIWLVAIAAAVTVVLTATWRYTRLGWVASAVSENQRATAALGWSPGVVSAATWGAGGALAAAGGILIAPITQLSIPNLTLTVIAALAAALLGGFRSFPLIFAGGLFLGVMQSETGNYVSISGASDALPFVLILLVLIFRGSALPLRGHVFDRLPRVGSGRVDARLLVPVVAAVVVILSLLRSADVSSALVVTFGVATILLSVLVLTGYTGQVSLAQYALAGLGALTTAHLVVSHNWPFPLAALCGAAVASGVGVVFALPALRTRGVNLTVITIGMGLAIESVVFDNGNYTGGFSGMTVSSLTIFGWHVEPVAHVNRYSVVCFLVFTVSAMAVANLRRGRSGRRLLAVRANERAAAASGVNVTAAKIHAFAVSGALAGIGGILVGFSTATLTFSGYGPLDSITAVGYSVIGGVGVVLGTLFGSLAAPGAVGALVFNAFSSQSAVQEYLPLAGGVAVLITLVAKPDGIGFGFGRGVVRALQRRFPAAPPKAVLTEIPDDDAIRRAEPRTLDVRSLSVRYGNVEAVSSVSFCVRPGEVVGLIGPNGAGKTSLMDAVTGFTRYQGSVRLAGVPIDRHSPRRRARFGLVRSFQALELFEDLTVLENLQTASDPGDLTSTVIDLVRPRPGQLRPQAVLAVREFGLEDDLGRRPAELSYGRRRLVAVARAVAAGPSVILLDEPVAGLNEHESLEISRLVRRLADAWGIGVLVIEHDMGFVMSLCDRIHVMDFGRTIAEGTPEEIRTDAAALAAYLGEEGGHDQDSTPGEPATAPPDRSAAPAPAAPGADPGTTAPEDTLSPAAARSGREDA